MPFINFDPWERDLFKHIDTQDTVIPVDDSTAFKMYPDHNWIYNKIKVAQLQDLCAYPHGVIPDKFPVFSKPIYSLYGMGAGAKVLYSWNEHTDYSSGYFWMPYLEGEQYSVDVVVINGSIVWQCTTEEHIDSSTGSFDYFSIGVYTPPNIQKVIKDWVPRYFSSFTGVLNFEFVDDKIIECHLRMSAQWVDLYGDMWLNQIVKLYKHGTWNEGVPVKKGYSVILRTKQSGKYRVTRDINTLLDSDGVQSIQLTFDPNIDVVHECNDDHTYRLAIINGTDLHKCLDVRDLLKHEFIMFL